MDLTTGITDPINLATGFLAPEAVLGQRFLNAGRASRMIMGGGVNGLVNVPLGYFDAQQRNLEAHSGLDFAMGFGFGGVLSGLTRSRARLTGEAEAHATRLDNTIDALDHELTLKDAADQGITLTPAGDRHLGQIQDEHVQAQRRHNALMQAGGEELRQVAMQFDNAKVNIPIEAGGSMSAWKVLKHIGESNKRLAGLAHSISRGLGPTEMLIEKVQTARKSGSYDMATHTAYVPARAFNNTEAILHETFHGATALKLHDAQNNPKAPKKSRQLLEETTRLMEFTKAELTKSKRKTPWFIKEQALTDPAEFLTYATTNPQFAKILNDLTFSDVGSVVKNRLYSAAATAHGVPANQRSALYEATRIGESLMADQVEYTLLREHEEAIKVHLGRGNASKVSLRELEEAIPAPIRSMYASDSPAHPINNGIGDDFMNTVVNGDYLRSKGRNSKWITPGQLSNIYSSSHGGIRSTAADILKFSGVFDDPNQAVKVAANEISEQHRQVANLLFEQGYQSAIGKAWEAAGIKDNFASKVQSHFQAEKFEGVRKQLDTEIMQYIHGDETVRATLPDHAKEAGEAVIKALDYLGTAGEKVNPDFHKFGKNYIPKQFQYDALMRMRRDFNTQEEFASALEGLTQKSLARVSDEDILTFERNYKAAKGKQAGYTEDLFQAESAEEIRKRIATKYSATLADPTIGSAEALEKAFSPDSFSSAAFANRVPMDELTTFTAPNGKEYSWSGLTEQNVYKLVKNTVDSVSPRLAMWEKGFLSDAHWKAKLDELHAQGVARQDFEVPNGYSLAQLNNDLESLGDIKDVMLNTGGMRNSETTKQMLRMFNSYAVATRGGYFSLSTLGDIGGIQGAMGYEWMKRAVPEVNQFLKDLKAGKVTDPEAKYMLSFATESLADAKKYIPEEHSAFSDKYSGSKLAEGTDATGKFLSGAAKAMMHVTGMNQVVAKMGLLSAVAAKDKLLFTALDGVGGKNLSHERLAGYGFTPEQWAHTAALLKKHTTRAEGEIHTTTDWDAFKTEAGQMVDLQWRTAVDRLSNHIVNRPQMDARMAVAEKHPALKMFLFLKTFALNSAVSTLIPTLGYRDAMAMNAMLGNMVTAAITYGLYSVLSTTGRADQQEELEKRFSPAVMAGGVLGRMNIMGMPSIADSIVDPWGWLNTGRTTNGNSSQGALQFFTGAPVVSTVTGAVDVAFPAIRATFGLDSREVANKSFGKAAAKLLVPNLAPFQAGMNALLEQLPDKEPAPKD
ncbi:hypothetical protein [Iodobacter sp.]|uniref:hypothetical protein n=1 Tax=Iodobacter sp. TaxID=1915058 RepID=UPI0025DD6C3E|nr:hypothetical protein [Iodobacter sp.]